MDSKIKVGQYVRFNNRLYEIESIEDETNWLRFKDNETVSAIGPKQFDNCKFGDTPQELIQDGDLVILDNYWKEPLFVSSIDKQGNPRTTVRTSSGSENINLTKYIDDITEIWTKTSEDTYTRQWRKEKC